MYSLETSAENMSLNQDTCPSQYIFHSLFFMFGLIWFSWQGFSSGVGVQGPIYDKLLETSPMCHRASAGQLPDGSASQGHQRHTGGACGIMYLAGKMLFKKL